MMSAPTPPSGRSVPEKKLGENRSSIASAVDVLLSLGTGRTTPPKTPPPVQAIDFKKEAVQTIDFKKEKMATGATTKKTEKSRLNYSKSKAPVSSLQECSTTGKQQPHLGQAPVISVEQHVVAAAAAMPQPIKLEYSMVAPSSIPLGTNAPWLPMNMGKVDHSCDYYYLLSSLFHLVTVILSAYCFLCRSLFVLTWQRLTFKLMTHLFGLVTGMTHPVMVSPMLYIHQQGHHANMIQIPGPMGNQAVVCVCISLR